MDREIWEPVKGYENLYAVSSLGEVKRLATTETKGIGRYGRVEHFLKQRKNNKGYLIVDLWKNNCGKQFLVHRLVAAAFVPNPFGREVVNHIDENKTNNKFENLEWCSQKENMNYGTCPKRIGMANGIPVAQVDRNSGEVIAIYSSGMDAQRKVGISNVRISECCTGKAKSAGGYIWARI